MNKIACLPAERYRDVTGKVLDTLRTRTDTILIR